MKRKPLNKINKELLSYLKAQRKTGMMPTRAEISNHMNWLSPNAAQLRLETLQKLGYIELIQGVSRGIRIL